MVGTRTEIGDEIVPREVTPVWLVFAKALRNRITLPLKDGLGCQRIRRAYIPLRLCA